MTTFIKAAAKLIDCVEFDMNGAGGKGGNGGLLSDTTLRAAHDLRVIMSREAEPPKVYNIGINTMAQVFKPSGLTDLHDLQAALDAVENALAAKALDMPVAEIVSKHGDPEAFGERELVALVDLQRVRYGTKLYAAAPAVQEGA